MKKSKSIKLILITAALASCHEKKKEKDWVENNVYMRSDTTAGYSRPHHGAGIGTALLWYYAFRPYGYYRGGNYFRSGYYSSAISQSANIGTSSTKSNIIRGGFGSSAYSVSS